MSFNDLTNEREDLIQRICDELVRDGQFTRFWWNLFMDVYDNISDEYSEHLRRGEEIGQMYLAEYLKTRDIFLESLSEAAAWYNNSDKDSMDDKFSDEKEKISSIYK